MKTILKFGCGAFLLAIVLVLGLIMYGQSTGEAVVKDFLSLAARDSSDEFVARIHPGLQEEVDPELLYLFFKGVLKECGDFQGLNMDGMSFSDNLKDGTRTQDFSGNFRFARKEVSMKMTFINGLLNAFLVNDVAVSEAGLKDADVIPASSEKKYAEKAEKFWRAGLSGKEAAAFDMMAENFQKQFGSEKIISILSEATKNNGHAESIKFISSRPEAAGSNKSLFFFSVDFPEAKNILAHTTIEFAGLRAHLVGFAIPSDEKP